MLCGVESNLRLELYTVIYDTDCQIRNLFHWLHEGMKGIFPRVATDLFNFGNFRTSNAVGVDKNARSTAFSY